MMRVEHDVEDFCDYINVYALLKGTIQFLGKEQMMQQ